jgi:hypothetical protein
MSLIVSASQRCSVAAAGVSRMVMNAALRLMWAGRQGRRCRSRDVSVKQSGGLHRFEGQAYPASRAPDRAKKPIRHIHFLQRIRAPISAACLSPIDQSGGLTFRSVVPKTTPPLKKPQALAHCGFPGSKIDCL